MAHAYLSFGSPAILVGNMVNDFVRGRQQYDYPSDIQKGFVLHRAIDHFTDTHAVTQRMKAFFRPSYRLYAGAFTDIVYDHFLARDQQVFDTENALHAFAAGVYALLGQYEPLLPQRFARLLPYMQQQDWLYNYRFTEGIQQSFNGLVRRATYLTESAIALDIFLRHYDALQDCYAEFFPALKSFSFHHLQQITAID